MKLLINGGAVDTIISLRHHRPDIYKYIGFMNTPKTSNREATLIRQGCREIHLDNAAYSGFILSRYQNMLQKWESISTIKVRWVAVPDVVADSQKTLHQFHEYAPRLSQFPCAFVGQDGCEDQELPWNEFRCFFVGGSTAWKLSRSAVDMMQEAKKRGKLVHVGRVNSQKRLRYAFYNDADTVDGTGYSKYNRKELIKALEYVKYLHDQGRLL